MHNKNYWENRYKAGEIQWDIGYASTPLVEYFKQLANKNLKILIPGCGSAYEGEWLHKNGFTNVFLLDVAPAAKEKFFERVPGFPLKHWLSEPFFEHQGEYDLIIEQTFFCALHPSQRISYVEKMHDLLPLYGKLVGLLFNVPKLVEGPPYGGTEEEYRALFQSNFTLKTMEIAHNSIEPRAERELFFIAENK